MKNPILPIAILLAIGTFAQAADPTDAQWQKMFEVMYGLPKSPKDSQLERLKSLIDEGADVNAAIGFDRLLREGETRADLRGTTWPLDVAVQQARVEMVKLLLAKGAKFHGGELALAALSGNQEESPAMITALLQAGADVNSRNDRLVGGFSFTALYAASHKGNKDAVKLLLAQPGIKLDATSDDDGDTALMVAAEGGHAEIVDMLLKAGANVNITDIGGETAITRAQKTLAKQQAIVSKLQSPQAETPKEPPEKKESPASPVVTKKDEKPLHFVEKPDMKPQFAWLPHKVEGEVTEENIYVPSKAFIADIVLPGKTRFRELIDPRYLKKHGLTDRDIAYEILDHQGLNNYHVADDLRTILFQVDSKGGGKELIMVRWVVYEGLLYISPEKAPDPKTGIFKPWILRTKVN